ncbi:hypothetical protein Q9L42_020265 (plasmid) [Methylomarinum sp. Ch1-1]|uniref:DUF4124 domain-containing protein n=1 Tax=Methylomarinum roseum TaxID=3067653 RepID=A0AAU7P0D6_9GAMM|nr:hypothetical protein [Methylomarinum sp. Ch1-1]MDP4523249.1 hypothetical protein [Methylomarinum sp. Ch1-1]
MKIILLLITISGIYFSYSFAGVYKYVAPDGSVTYSMEKKNSNYETIIKKTDYKTLIKENRKKNINKYSKQIEKADKLKLPLIITKIKTSQPNIVNGVDVDIDFLSTSDLPLKYVLFEVIPYNAVQDIVSSEINGKTTAYLKGTGPYYRGDTNRYNHWANTWYNPTIVCAALVSVVVIFLDETKKVYINNALKDLFLNQKISISCPKPMER